MRAKNWLRLHFHRRAIERQLRPYETALCSRKTVLEVSSHQCFRSACIAPCLDQDDEPCSVHPAPPWRSPRADATETATRLTRRNPGPPRVRPRATHALAKDFGVDLHSVTGTGPGGRIVAREVEGAKGSNWVATPGATTATPKAQKLAKKEAVDLSTVAATGRFGRVTEDDVKRALGTLTEALGIQQGATIDVYPQLGSVPMTGMQQAIAANMEKTLDVPVFRVSKLLLPMPLMTCTSSARGCDRVGFVSPPGSCLLKKHP